MNKQPTPEVLRKHFCYNPQTGEIRWKQSSRNFKSGQLGGGLMSKGYMNIYFGGKILKAHRVAYALMRGAYPPCQIDHKDGNKANNAWSNLRLATNAQNQHNVGLRRDNKSGVKGVYFHNQSQKWTAQITVNGKMVTIDRFLDKADAIKVRHAESLKLHKEFAKL
jgi:hypothetical protein